MDFALTIIVAALVIWLTVRGISTQTAREKYIAYAVGALALVLIGASVDAQNRPVVDS